MGESPSVSRHILDSMHAFIASDPCVGVLTEIPWSSLKAKFVCLSLSPFLLLSPSPLVKMPPLKRARTTRFLRLPDASRSLPAAVLAARALDDMYKYVAQCDLLLPMPASPSSRLPTTPRCCLRSLSSCPPARCLAARS